MSMLQMLTSHPLKPISHNKGRMRSQKERHLHLVPLLPLLQLLYPLRRMGLLLPGPEVDHSNATPRQQTIATAHGMKWVRAPTK